MSPEELELLVERFCFFNLTANEALQVLRDRFDKQTFTEIYSREEREWKATADMNPLAKFPLNDSDQQEAFFQAVEGVCREVDKIQSDYPALVRVSFAAYTAMYAIIMPDQLFPDGSPHPSDITLKALPRITSANKLRISSRREQASTSTILNKIAAFKKPPVGQTLELGDIIFHTRPGSDKRFECTVVGFGISRAKGQWFLVSYADNPGAEVELNGLEMGDILAHRITVA